VVRRVTPLQGFQVGRGVGLVDGVHALRGSGRKDVGMSVSHSIEEKKRREDENELQLTPVKVTLA
jgi:hypothetical protein